MPAKRFTASRPARRILFTASAVLSLALWLTLTVAEGYRPLHAWLHGGTIPKDDDCAVVMFLHGKVDTAAVVVNVPVAPALVIAEALTPAPIFTTVDRSLLPTRGPPACLS